MDSLKLALGSVFGGRRATDQRRFLLPVALYLCLGPLGLAAARDAAEPPNRPLSQGEFTAELNGLRLWFKVSGAGPVCLMPSPAWGVSSDPYFRTLQPLEKSFTMVYLDSRGTGRSQKAASTKEYTWDHLVADLDALRTHLQQEKVWLMGHSEGGTQILHYACQYPARIRGLVLLDATAVRDEESKQDMASRQQRRKDEPWFPEAMKALQGRQSEPSDADLKANMMALMPFYWSDPARIAAHASDLEATGMSAVAWRGQTDSRRYSFDLREPLKHLRAPALIVVGDDDFVCSPLAAKRLHLCLPNSKLLLIEGAGHFPWLEQPDVFFRDVPAFLEAMQERR
ncbi:MAG: alpha/beta hydrolase [Planctomycetes bacterium]|nr:alpha/beta hydrolase [Planctomycetota bacterium]